MQTKYINTKIQEYIDKTLSFPVFFMDRLLLSSIFRKLPLKFLLVLLAVCAVFIACFSSAVELPQSNWAGNTSQGDLYFIQSDTVSVNSSSQQYHISVSDFVFICVRREGSIGIQMSLDNSTWTDIGYSSQVCTTSNTFYLKSKGSTTAIYGLYFTKDIPLFDSLKMTSLQCQTEYNLIPISSVDQNYCTSNNLCPSQECPTCPVCPVGSGGVSTLYINNVLHVGAPFIYMNIPEEIDRDYAYTQGGTNMNIDIEGYNQDADYINGLIDINNYKPTSEDFNNTFSLFGSFSGLLVACLFVILIFYFIKKIFK